MENCLSQWELCHGSLQTNSISLWPWEYFSPVPNLNPFFLRNDGPFEQKPKIQGSKKTDQNKTKLPEGQILVAVCGDGWPCAELLSAYANNNLGWHLSPWREPTWCPFQQRVRHSFCWVELISPWPVAGGHFKGSVAQGAALRILEWHWPRTFLSFSLSLINSEIHQRPEFIDDKGYSTHFLVCMSFAAI